MGDRSTGRPATSGVIDGAYALSVGKPDRSPPDGWQWRPLTSLARLESGHTPSRRKGEYWGGSIPWIGIRDATGNHGLVIDSTREYVTDDGIANSSARVLPAHTVCLSRTASVGYVVAMGRPMATSQAFVNWVCGPDLDWRYLMYVLLAEKESFSRFAHGTAHQTIYFPEVKAFHVCLPSLNHQKAIAGVLWALDSRISGCRAQAETLEGIAAALFKSRFVDFDGVTEFEDSEIGSIPKGWRVEPLADLGQFVNGGAYTKHASGDGRMILRIADLNGGISASTRYGDFEVPRDHTAAVGDILFAWSGSLGVWLWPGPEAIINQHIFNCRPREGLPVWFLHQALLKNLPEFRAIAADKATTMGHIKREHLSQVHVLVPPPNVLEHADDLMSDIYERMVSLQQQVRTVSQLRDSLLPRLVSGDLKVPDSLVEIYGGEAAPVAS